MTQSECEQIIWQHLNASGNQTLLTRQRWLWAHDRKAEYGAQDVPDDVWSAAYMAVNDALKDSAIEWEYVGVPADQVRTEQIGLAVSVPTQ